MSEEITKLVALAEQRGLVADKGDWSEALVYWFDALMPSDVRDAGNASAVLEYVNSDGTPHNPAGEGFIDREAKAAISFLLEPKEA